jgi:ABC-type Mn2+/Zn2+ transport system permease subunit
MLETFTLPYVQEGLIEILLLSVPAGLIGTWIVLRARLLFACDRHSVLPGTGSG